MPLHAADLLGRFKIPDLAENFGHELVEHRHHVVLVHEGHLDVDLREFRLTVGAEVFVAEALRNLEVAVHAGDHQKLLVLLRRLREGVELARVHTARHQVVAGAFRSGLAEHRRFDVFKTVSVEEVVHGLEEAALEQQLLLDPRTAEVQVTVLQAQVVVFLALFVRVVDGERGGKGRVQDFNLVNLDFDFTRGELLVGVALFAGVDLTGHRNHVFVAELFGGLHHVGVVVRVEDDLGLAILVAEVHKNHTTMVAAAVHPTGECYGLANICLAQLAAVMSTFHFLRPFGIFRRRI